MGLMESIVFILLSSLALPNVCYFLAHKTYLTSSASFLSHFTHSSGVEAWFPHNVPAQSSE